MKRLGKLGISAVVNYRPVHLLTYYRKKYGFKEGDFPIAEKLSKETLILPLYPSLTTEQLIKVTETIKESIKEWDYE